MSKAKPVRYIRLVQAAIAAVCIPALLAQAPQKTFDTPQLAAEALIAAAENNNHAVLLELFGPDGKDLVDSGDPIQDKNAISGFAAAAKEKNSVVVDPQNRSRAILSVGNDDWPLPVPIVKKGSKWHFDAEAGRDEILKRRIGANELDAIQVCRGFVEAQKEYASEIHDSSGTNQYAHRIISSPGRKDGLYWTNKDGTPGGPVSEAVARAIQEGYPPQAGGGYHGYHFKVLMGQGPAAPMGQLDYVIKGLMIGGFALVAVPSQYGVSGIKTFMVSHDGIVYEKDLGAKTTDIVASMDRFNPDKTWHPTEDEWPPDVF